MPIPLILGVASLAMGAAQYFGGRAKAKKLAKMKYDIPQEYKDNLAAAQQLKNRSMDKETYQQAQQNIGRNQNFGLAALQDRGKALAGVGNIVQRSNDANLKLDAADAQMRNQNFVHGTGMEMQAKQQIALQKLAKQDFEKFRPLMGGEAEQGAGIQNAMGGLNAMGSWYGTTQANNLNFWTGNPINKQPQQLPPAIQNADFSSIKWRG